ncbi:hypothetical protein CcaCcLH18_02956 [Colletotrichum camelliae]|nr:hypothetical protein CcaCcLH18_02956 [Colletotrichum camelliae]
MQLMETPPQKYLSQPGRRLYWTLQGPLSSALFVMPNNLDPDAPREAYFQQTLSGTSWHPIAQEPVTEQPVASLTVQEVHLSDWQNEWYTMNQEGFDDDVQPAPEDFPLEFKPLVVTASSPGAFVTVQDFVSAVHPWLMGQRNQILRARNIDDEEYTPGPDERLLITADSPESLSVEDEQEQLGTLRWLFDGYRRTEQQRQQEHEQQQEPSGRRGL